MKSRIHFTALLVVLTLLLFAPPLQAQTTWHVDDNAPGDPGPGDTAVSDPLEDGTTAHPFDAIQEGMDAAVYGDTVLVADGTYTGEGNRDMSFLGKAITVASANGPENCIIDINGSESVNLWGFEFVNGEGLDSILEGFTITRATGFVNSTTSHGSAVYILSSSPTIIGNVITECSGSNLGRGGGIWGNLTDARIIGNTITGNWNEGGAGLRFSGSAPLIADNIISNNFTTLNSGGGILLHYGGAARIVGNLISGNEGFNGGGLFASEYGDYENAPLIENNIFIGNEARYVGGGLRLQGVEPASFVNNLIVENHSASVGSGVYCTHLDTDNGVTRFQNCTIAGNTGWGLYIKSEAMDEFSTLELVDCILAHNGAGPRRYNLWMGGAADTITVVLDHCLVEDGAHTVHIGLQTLIQASPVILDDPLFAAGVESGYCLSQFAAGQDSDSPALDAGSDLASNICTGGEDETVCMDELATRTDGAADTGVVDLGYHYSAPTGTVSASLGCVPSAGTLPFSSRFTVSMTNHYSGLTRRMQYQVDVTLAGGHYYSSWRRGWQNVQADTTYTKSWWQDLPGWGTLVGDTFFLLTTADVTPPPYNLPPYPPSGDTDTASCTVTGEAP